MSKFKGTPGPWLLSKYEDGGVQVADIFDSNGECKTACLNIDDARLIAAAPELLEALCKTRRTIQALIDDGHMGYVDLRSSIDAAIAKALGEDAT